MSIAISMSMSMEYAGSLRSDVAMTNIRAKRATYSIAIEIAIEIGIETTVAILC